MRPIIALTTTMAPGGSYGLPQVMLGKQYVARIEEVGGTPLLVTPAHSRDSIEPLLHLAHALVLSGGEDVDPAHYGQERHPKLGKVNEARDAMEFAALEVALARELPILAICRGMQLLNVAFGGTLYQDLAALRPGHVPHEQQEPVNERSHHVRIDPDSGLHRIMRTKDVFINSFHHQGIDRLAEGLRATAWAEDGLVEAVEAPDRPWVHGVQWHPERGEATTPDDPHPDMELFHALIAAAQERAESAAAVR